MFAEKEIKLLLEKNEPSTPSKLLGESLTPV